MDEPLPRRPRVVAGLRVFRRGPHDVQIGLEPRSAAVITGLPEPVALALQRLNGDRDLDELRAGLCQEDAGTLAGAVRALAARGLVEDGDRPEVPLAGRLAGDRAAAALRAVADRDQRADPAARRGLAVGVHGTGRLAVSVATQLAAAGVGWVRVATTGSVRPEDVGTGYLADDIGRRRSAAAREAVARVDPGVRTTTFRADRGPDLVVLADSLVYEPARITALNTAGVPHLTVRMRDGTGIVGPLVVPGLTSCLMCADLQRCDRDKHWPGIAAQLTGQVQHADLAATVATAAFAVTQVLDSIRWLRGATAPPATCETSIELDLGAAVVRRRSWLAHPLCSCGVSHRCSNVAANSDDELRQSKT